MAISIHTVEVRRSELGALHVVEDAEVANSADSPTVKDYLEAEAADDYLPVVYSQWSIITALVSDINAL